MQAPIGLEAWYASISIGSALLLNPFFLDVA